VHSEIQRTFQENLTELFPFVSTCYSSSFNLLCFGEFLISSTKERSNLGDPLGPLLFRAASLRLAKFMKASLNSWYMDDGTLGDNVDVLINDYQAVPQIDRRIGLELNEH